MPVACSFDSIYVVPGTVGAGLGTGGPITVTLYVSSGGTGNPNATLLSLVGNIEAGPVMGDTSTPTTALSASITGDNVSVSAGDSIAIQASGNGINNGTGSLSVSLHCGVRPPS
jgi:hypothetical protein